MKLRSALLIVLLFSLFLTGCKKTCRCYRYDGNVDEFSEEELKDRGTACEELENYNNGTVYSLCEKVAFSM